MRQQPMRGGDAARHVMVMLPSHQEQVGRQHRHGHPGIGQAPADLAQAGMIDGGELGDMADRDPAAPAMGIGLAAHFIEMHP